MTNKCTIISQIITLLHVSTLSCHPQGACNEYLNYKLYYHQLHLKYLCNLARYWLQAPWGWHDSVETCRSAIICEIIVHLLVIVQNNKKLKKQKNLLTLFINLCLKTYLVVKICSIPYLLKHDWHDIELFSSPQTFRNHVNDAWHVTTLSTNYMEQPCHVVTTVFFLFSEFVLK